MTRDRIQELLDKLGKLHELRNRVNADILEAETEIEKEIARLGQAQTALAEALQRRRVAQCGTDGGYYRHVRTRKEEACDGCKRAHAVAERVRAARRTNAA